MWCLYTSGMNRAQRLLSIYDSLLGLGSPSGMKAADAWAKALEIEGRKGERDGALARAMLAFQDEIDALTAQLVAAGIPQECYHSQLRRLRDAAAPGTMRSSWDGLLGSVNPADVRLALLWSGAAPIAVEGAIPDEQLAALGKLLDELDEGFAGAGLPPTMSEYAAMMLRSLREALELHRIKGTAPLRTAVQHAYGATVSMGDALAAEVPEASPSARSYIGRVNSMITRAVVVCRDVDIVNKGGSAMVTMAEKLQIALNAIAGVIDG